MLHAVIRRIAAQSSELVIDDRDGGTRRIAPNDAAMHSQLQPAVAFQEKWPGEANFDGLTDRQDAVAAKTNAATADVGYFAATGSGGLGAVAHLECNRKSTAFAPIRGENHAGGHGLPPYRSTPGLLFGRPAREVYHKPPDFGPAIAILAAKHSCRQAE